MNVIEKPHAVARANDLDRFRLRRFIEELGPDEIEQRDAPVDIADIAGDPRRQYAGGALPAVGPERQELVGNVVSSRAASPAHSGWRRSGLPPRSRAGSPASRRSSN